MAHRLSPSEETLLARFQERLLAAVPAGTIRAIIVFGSRARGNSGPNSDLDVAVMLAPGVERAPMQRIVFDTGYDVGEELDLLELGLAPIALPPEPRIALHASIDRDGMEIWRA